MGILTNDDGLVDAALSEILTLPIDRKHKLDPLRHVDYLLMQNHLAQVSYSVLSIFLFLCIDRETRHREALSFFWKMLSRRASLLQPVMDASAIECIFNTLSLLPFPLPCSGCTADRASILFMLSMAHFSLPAIQSTGPSLHSFHPKFPLVNPQNAGRHEARNFNCPASRTHRALQPRTTEQASFAALPERRRLRCRKRRRRCS